MKLVLVTKAHIPGQIEKILSPSRGELSLHFQLDRIRRRTLYPSLSSASWPSLSRTIRTLDFDSFTRRSHNSKRDFYMESVDEMMPRLMLLRLLHLPQLRFLLRLHLRHWHSWQQKGRDAATATDIGMWQRHFTPFAFRLSSAACSCCY